MIVEIAAVQSVVGRGLDTKTEDGVGIAVGRLWKERMMLGWLFIRHTHKA